MSIMGVSVRGPKRGPVWAAQLWLRQRRRRWRTRRERRTERDRRRRSDERASNRVRWRYRRWLRWTIVATAWTFLGWTLLSLILTVLGTEPRLLPMAKWCAGDQPRAYYCGQVEGFVKPLMVAALGLAFFYFWRYIPVRRWYRRNVMRNSRMVLPSAERGLDPSDVVGRDELCELLIQRLRDRATRRPLLLVGGIGTGKTATLARLAEMLMAADVVPVGVDLRSVTDPEKLNFRQLALEQFERTIDTRLRAAGEADRIWRRLWLENRLVVLADGLEESLADAAQPADRDSVLRDAIRVAVRERLPLVVASRPDDPLRGLDALLLQLEPLAQGPALEYVRARSRRSDAGHRWDRINELVKAADVADSPFYLRVIGQLYEVDRLDRVEPVGPGRAALRWCLLEEWCDATVAGDLYEDYGLPQVERSDAIEVLSALACIGLRDNRLSVRTTELTGGDDTIDAGRRWILTELRNRLHKLDAGNAQDVGLAETTGDALNIVVKRQDGVRFQHGVIQAYLGARFLTAAMRDPGFLDRAFAHHHGPGRELLAALTLHTRSAGAFEQLDGRRQPTVRPGNLPRLGDAVRQKMGLPAGGRDAKATRNRSVDLLRRLCDEATRTRNRTRALEMFAAALEMDAATGHTSHRRLADAIRSAWCHYQGDGSVTDRPLEDAKIALVHRYGDAARQLVDRPPDPTGLRSQRPTPQYDQLLLMMADEGSYLPRLAAAREIAAGGNAAVRALRDRLFEPPKADESPGQERLDEIRTWMTPSLFLYADDEHAPGEPNWRHEAHQALQRWVHRLANDATDGARVYELTLAQGFRLAANCRVYPAHRSLLIEEAEKALRDSRFWYSHLVLIQALTLLALPRDPGETLRERGHGSDPRGLVDFWASIAGGGDRAPYHHSGTDHPLVRKVADLCVESLVDRHPERHCWIDEREIVGRVGTVSPQPGIRRLQDSWLPASHGWAVLEPRAQRLLADVMLLLNLADRGRNSTERASRLTRASRPELPPCLTIDRTAMRVTLGRRQAHDVQPGSTCIDDCPFRLCPLPPKGDELPYQMEEVFCAHQIDLVGHWFRPGARADWQAVNRKDLRTFWREMSERMAPAWRK
ncbi:NACHT domain-containing protein [Micromonospora peucetia]|uniref:Cdc6-related protein, AAA superfamily ATPase n=1 Tax=Micromonospora peucetia TaxID=47871 RepID=A0A1C6UCB5_9ACTN|nr:NACHT domain-containing protein [Micromonospora peucetia]WSA33800.1 NACHT domain-containing protein [Micromonospora peucetia]SCL51551.1 Cdc6-related protein, AAA superfamily ATPase [Micromonospora peucetia]